MTDTDSTDVSEHESRRRYELEDTGFREVPKRWRKFYRHWQGDGDQLGPNEIQCPVCKVVIRSHHEFRPGDRGTACRACLEWSSWRTPTARSRPKSSTTGSSREPTSQPTLDVEARQDPIEPLR